MLARLLATVIIGVVVNADVSAQTVSSNQAEAIRSALQRIAISNSTVENIIYDGMTYQEVLQILGRNREQMSIQFRGNPDLGNPNLDFYCPVGRYYLHWSGSAYDNPVVVGYSMGLDGEMRHNRLQ